MKKPESEDTDSDLLKILKSLKSDLVKLQMEKSGNAILQINNVEVELAMTVEKKAGGGFKIGVVHLGADYKKENINRIKIDLTPLLSNNNKNTDVVTSTPQPTALSPTKHTDPFTFGTKT